MYFQTPSYRDCSAPVILFYKKSSKSRNAKTLLTPWRKKKSKNLANFYYRPAECTRVTHFYSGFQGLVQLVSVQHLDCHVSRCQVKKKKKGLEIFFKMRLLFMAFRAVRYPWFLLSSHSLDQIHSYPEQRSGSLQENGRQRAKWWAPWAFKGAQSGKDFKSNFHAKEHQ